MGGQRCWRSTGGTREALRWYDRLVARMAPDRLDAVREADGWLALESVALRGRREVRRELGLPRDETNEIVPDPPEGGLDAMLERLAGLERRTPHRAVERVLIFQRAERAEAHRRWPDDYDDDSRPATPKWSGAGGRTPRPGAGP